MSFVKIFFTLLFFHPTVRTCLAKNLIQTSKLELSSNLVDVLAEILKSCYGKRVTAVGLAGDIPRTLIASLSSDPVSSLPVIVLNARNKSESSDRVPRESQYGLQLFAIGASSPMKLQTILTDMKKSRWWNHMANFYIFDWFAGKNGCGKAFDVLRVAWQNNLLKTSFVCTRGRRGRFIYTFNPYTRYAPVPWHLETIHNDENNHPCAMLVLEYHTDYNGCKKIEFDKTKDLGGHEIRSTVSHLALGVQAYENGTGIDSLGGPLANVLKTIFYTVNATIKLLIHEPDEALGTVDDDGTANGILAETASGTSDITFIGRSLLVALKLKSLYPHDYSGLRVITQHRGYKSQLSKIVSVIDVRSRIGLCITLVVTLTFFKYCVRQSLSTGILNVVRMICNAAFTNLPDKVPARIYLATLFVFLVTIQAVYQGQLASLLTKRQPLKDVDTKEDLVNSAYRVYSYNLFHRVIREGISDDRFIGVHTLNCTGYVLRDPTVACVGFSSQLVGDAARFNLHRSKYAIVEFYTSWVIREDWPLEQRFNEVLRTAVEAHLIQYSEDKHVHKWFRDIKANDYTRMDQDQTHRTLTLDDLSFAFAILGIGSSFAFISFIIEIIVKPKRRTRYAEARRLFRGRIIQ